MFCAQSQNTTLISTGTKLTLSGNVFLTSGAGKIINNGTIGGTTGTLVFGGAVNYSGTGITQVQNFVVAHSGATTSVLNAPIDVTNTANLMFGNLTLNNNLVLRSDISNTANLVVTGAPSGLVDGLIAKADPAVGGCTAFNSNLTVNISGPQIRYQWQSSPDSDVWTDITGAILHDYTARVTGSTFYRCRIGNSINNNFTQFVDPILVRLDTTVTVTTSVSTVAAGSTVTLTTTAVNGTWISNDTSVAKINDASGVTTGIHAGTAAVTYTGVTTAGCAARTSITVSVTAVAVVIPVTPVAPVTLIPVVRVTNPAAVCSPATVDLTAAAITAGSSPTLTYTYYTNAAATVALASPDKVALSGTYYIVGTTSAGTPSVPVPIVVSIITAPSLVPGFTFDSYCINTPVVLSNTSVVQGQVAYQWSDNTGKTSSAVAPSFTYTQTGVVNLKLKVSSLVCALIQDSITKIITIEQPATAIRMQPVNIIANEPTTIRARTFGSSYTWTPATNLSAANIVDPKVTLTSNEQEYRITIKAASACITVDTILTRIFERYIYVPNAFTPNGDGINDLLYVNVIGSGLRTLTYFRIYNRYSKLVFQTTDATIGWDGKVNGVYQPLDTYIWIAEVKDASGFSTTTRRGSVSLLR